MEVTSAGVQRAYVMSNGAVVAQLNPNGSFYWLHLDHLESGRKMTDSSGNMVYRAEFDPYGKLPYEWSSPTNLNTHKITGYEPSNESLAAFVDKAGKSFACRKIADTVR